MEQSIIDFVLISSDLIKHLEYIHVDDKRVHVLSKNVKNKNNIHCTQSDHNMINTKLNVSWSPTENRVIEIFKFKDKAALEKFKFETTYTDKLSKLIDTDKPLDVVTKKFIKRLQGFIHKCFKKVRIVEKEDKKLEALYNKRRILRSNNDEASQIKLEEVEKELCEKYSEVMCNKIMGELKDMGNCEEGGYNSGKLWQSKKELSPRFVQPPSAMMNSEGQLLTNNEDITKEAVKHYKNVFKNADIKEGLEDVKSYKEQLCKDRLVTASHNKTPVWTVTDVKDVLKQLKSGKSKDPYDLPNELFQPNVAGDDLILAITKLMNRIKSELSFPSPMNVCNVTNLYKNKGPQQQFDSYRGIFRTPVLRNILDKLIYDKEYQNIDNYLTNCNVGSRRGRNVRDNLFVINAVMNQSKQNPKEAVDIGVYDIHKCFDSLWLDECINDLYDAGLQNDQLNVLYNSNLNARIVVKTSSGETERFPIRQVVMQGTVWAGLMCTNSMDKLCKLIYNNEDLLFKYRGVVSVPPLEMVDDIVTASKCGENSTKLNHEVNMFIDSKKLKLSSKKCANIHIGNKKSRKVCPNKKVGDELMKESDKEKYLGDLLTNKANSKDTLESRKTRGYAILGNISALLKDVPMGNRRTQIGIDLRKSWFLNSCLFNSEVWSGVSETNLKDLNIIDHQILQAITGAQAKVPTEMLYLETSQLPLSHVISVRRLVYWHTILKRQPTELTRQIYNAMKDNPIKGDWIELLKDDLEKVGLTLEDEPSISGLSKDQFKSKIKKKIKELSNHELECIKSGHDKVRTIVHHTLEKPQEYLTSGLFTNSQRSILFNLRSMSERSFRDNFHRMYQDNLCQLCKSGVDSQEHALSCIVLNGQLNQEDKATLRRVDYQDIFGDLQAQLCITKLYQTLIRIKRRLLKPVDQPTSAYPGINSGPIG